MIFENTTVAVYKRLWMHDQDTCLTVLESIRNQFEYVGNNWHVYYFGTGGLSFCFALLLVLWVAKKFICLQPLLVYRSLRFPLFNIKKEVIGIGSLFKHWEGVFVSGSYFLPASFILQYLREYTIFQ